MEISGTVPGDADDGEDGQVTFVARQEDQGTALLLQGGVVYMGFASYGDKTPYHGWVFGYNVATLQQVSAWNSTPKAAGAASGSQARAWPPTPMAKSF